MVLCCAAFRAGQGSDRSSGCWSLLAKKNEARRLPGFFMASLFCLSKVVEQEQKKKS
jgi:hypothetical protein